jgi:hypothetical protein
MKAAVHGALALVGLIEAFDSRSRTRKILTGCMAGFHIHATFYHLFIEEDGPKIKPEIKPEIVLDSEIEFW